MKRHLALISFAFGSAGRRAGRTLSIAFALALVTFCFSSVLFLTEALRREARLGAAALPDLTIQILAAGRPALVSEKECEPIATIPGVVAVQPRVWGYYFVPTLSGNFTVVGVDTDAEDVQRDLSLVLRKGRLPQGSGAGEVVVGESLAAFLGLKIGDAVIFPVGRSTKRLVMVGLFQSQVALWTADVILMSVADAREFLNVPKGYATDIAVRLSTPDEAAVAARKIAELMPAARIVDRQLVGRTYDLTFDTRGGMMGAMLMSALVAFLILAWDRFTAVGPGERGEIGVLKAIGWRTSDVLVARLWENTLIGIYGALPGILAAYAYVFYARAPGLAQVLLGWSSIYPALRLAPAVDLGQVLVLLCLVVIPFVAASLVPAWQAATRDPYGLLRGVT